MKISSDYPFDNRAAIYGDGCFTTAAIVSGRVELLDYHVRRLSDACKKLHITVSESEIQSLKNTMSEQAVKCGDGVLKVLISAGKGGRGYRREQHSEAEAFIQISNSVSHYVDWRTNGITVCVSPVKLACNQLLSGVKHLNRLEQVLLRGQNLAGDDAIVCDQQNMVVESFAGNVFWYTCGRWFTPDLTGSGVSGVMRNYLLDATIQSGKPVSIVRANLDALLSASEIFICNSLMKIVPVNRITDVNGETMYQQQDRIQTQCLSNLINTRVFSGT